MLITRSSSSFANKPAPSDFNNVVFCTEDCSLDTIVNYAINGHILTFNFKDSCFVRKKDYMRYNYKSTCFVFVDIDHSSLKAQEIISKMKFKPTFWHTSYNHQRTGENKYHFYFFFNKPIYGEENYKIAYNMIIEGIEDLVDSNSKDCHRMIFTSNCTYPNHEWECSGILYNVPEECTKACNIPPSNTHKSTNTSKITGTAPLSGNFWNDFKTMGRGEFLIKYLPQYPFYYETPIDFQGKSYYDLSNTDYYIVNPLRYKFDKDKRKMVRNKVKIGKRHGQLFKDAIQFRAVNPNITLEGLVIALVHDVLSFYDNSDGEMTNRTIFSEAKDIMNDPHSPIKSNKKMKVNMAYFDDSMSVPQKVGQARKDHTDDRIAETIENKGLQPTVSSIEDVLSALRENSIHITKKRLLQFCDKYDMNYPSKKELDHRQVLFLHYQNPNLSSRQLEDLCKSKGIKISYKTIQTIIKNDNNVLRKYYYSDLQIFPGLIYFPNDFKIDNCNYITDTQELLRHIYAA